MRTARGRRTRRLLVVAVGLAALALAGRVLYDSSDELLAAADTLTHLNWSWVALALLAELASYLVRGQAMAAVLRVAAAHPVAPDVRGPRRGRSPGTVTLSAGLLAGDAAAYCLPFGFAASGVVMVGMLHRRRVDPTVAGWLYAVSTVIYVSSIAVLTVIAVQVAGAADPIPGLWQVSVGLLLVLMVVAGVYAVPRRRRARRHGGMPALRRDIGEPLPEPPPVDVAGPERRTGTRRPGPVVRIVSGANSWLRARLAELRRIRLPVRTGVSAFALMTLSWLCSIAVLALAYPAVGETPPWTGLLLAFCASQIASAIPVTPGGIGVVEGSLTLALVAFGGAQTVTLAAVLLYRLVTYWVCIPLGGLAWLALRVSAPPVTPTPPAAPAPRKDGR